MCHLIPSFIYPVHYKIFVKILLPERKSKRCFLTPPIQGKFNYQREKISLHFGPLLYW